MMGSMMLLLIAHRVSMSIRIVVFEAPCDFTNFRSASTVRPRRRRPYVGFALMTRQRIREDIETYGDRGERGVVPARNDLVVHEPLQLPLGQERVAEVQAADSGQ
jgi:hypothetical protein